MGFVLLGSFGSPDFSHATRRAQAAGHKGNNTLGNVGCPLLQHPKIAKPLTERQAEVFRRVDVSADSVKAKLAKNTFANVGDYVSIGRDRLPRADLSRASRDQLAALQDMSVGEKAAGKGGTAVKRIRVKLADNHSPV